MVESGETRWVVEKVEDCTGDGCGGGVGAYVVPLESVRVKRNYSFGNAVAKHRAEDFEGKGRVCGRKKTLPPSIKRLASATSSCKVNPSPVSGSLPFCKK